MQLNVQCTLAGAGGRGRFWRGFSRVWASGGSLPAGDLRACLGLARSVLARWLAMGLRPARVLPALVLGAALAVGAHAGEAPEVGSDPAAERHMMQLAAELRCLQCQNQTLADSEAPLAVDLRQQIRELLAKGQTDQQIKEYLGARYGDFVFYRPPVQGNTLLLWFGPAVLLVGGLLALFVTLKRRLARLEAAGVSAELSDADARRAQHLLDDETGESSLS